MFKPNSDEVLYSIFNEENEEVMKDFIECILQRKVKSVKLEGIRTIQIIEDENNDKN